MRISLHQDKEKREFEEFKKLRAEEREAEQRKLAGLKENREEEAKERARIARLPENRSPGLYQGSHSDGWGWLARGYKGEIVTTDDVTEAFRAHWDHVAKTWQDRAREIDHDLVSTLPLGPSYAPFWVGSGAVVRVPGRAWHLKEAIIGQRVYEHPAARMAEQLFTFEDSYQQRSVLSPSGERGSFGWQWWGGVWSKKWSPRHAGW